MGLALHQGHCIANYSADQRLIRYLLLIMVTHVIMSCTCAVPVAESADAVTGLNALPAEVKSTPLPPNPLLPQFPVNPPSLQQAPLVNQLDIQRPHAREPCGLSICVLMLYAGSVTLTGTHAPAPSTRSSASPQLQTAHRQHLSMSTLAMLELPSPGTWRTLQC